MVVDSVLTSKVRKTRGNENSDIKSQTDANDSRNPEEKNTEIRKNNQLK